MVCHTGEFEISFKYVREAGMVAVDLAALDRLKIEGGVIRTRGLYYAERRFVPHYHARCDSGQYTSHQIDPDGNVWHICRVTEEERSAFPELSNVSAVGILVTRGRVCSWTFSCSYRKAKLMR